SSRRRHTRFSRDWSSDVCSSDLEGLFRRRAEQRAVTPDARKELGDGALDLLPELPVVRLEERAAQPLLDRFFKEQEQSPDVDVRSEERRVGKECRCR